MSTNRSSSSQVRGMAVTPEFDDFYASLLPTDLVDWVRFEAPTSYTYQSIHAVWTHCQKDVAYTILMLKGASALDCEGVYNREHPGSFTSLKFAEAHSRDRV